MKTTSTMTEQQQAAPNGGAFDRSISAQTVGNQFVSQYYTVLHSSPKRLHRFYADASTMTHVDVRVEHGSITQNLKTATGQKMIQETVMNLNFEDTMTEIYSVDSQYSLSGGVVVQVTGALQNKEGLKRAFAQTFFLAVQEKGYYVLNDIFRYLLPHSAVLEQVGVVEKQSLGSETANHRSSSPPAVPTPRSPHQHVSQQTTSSKESESEHVFQVDSGSFDSGDKVTGMKTGPVETVQFSEGGVTAKSKDPAEKAVPHENGDASVTGGDSAGEEMGPEAAVVSQDVPHTEGVFIRDIPSTVTLEDLTKALERFGPLKANSLSIKSMKGRDSYAFVDFLSVESAQDCLSKGMELDGKKVSVEPKRPTIFRQTSNTVRKYNNKQNIQSRHQQMQRSMQMPHPPAFSTMQFPHPHMVIYPSGTIGMPVSMGMPMAPALLTRMQPPPPPPPPPSTMNAYPSPGQHNYRTQKGRSKQSYDQGKSSDSS